MPELCARSHGTRTISCDRKLVWILGVMATFDYATPKWADGDAIAAANIQTLGRLAATLTDITMSLVSSSAAALPKRTAGGRDFSLGDLLFLSQYVFTHMSFMDADARADLAENEIGNEYVFVHAGWFRDVSEVMKTMAYQVTARHLAHPDVRANVPFSAEDWIVELEFQADTALKMANTMDQLQ